MTQWFGKSGLLQGWRYLPLGAPFLGREGSWSIGDSPGKGRPFFLEPRQSNLIFHLDFPLTFPWNRRWVKDPQAGTSIPFVTELRKCLNS